MDPSQVINELVTKLNKKFACKIRNGCVSWWITLVDWTYELIFIADNLYICVIGALPCSLSALKTVKFWSDYVIWTNNSKFLYRADGTK
jgi:hypothetical protein